METWNHWKTLANLGMPWQTPLTVARCSSLAVEQGQRQAEEKIAEMGLPYSCFRPQSVHLMT